MSNMFPNHRVQHSSAVPVVHYKSSAGWVVPVSLLLAFTGFIPWGIFASTTDELRYMSHGFWWLIVSWPLLASVIVPTLHIKVQGYQPLWEKLTMIGLAVFGLAMCTLPVVSTLLYGSGIGN